ncbi:MAG: hypothetical protein AAGU27_17530 [Dehalobacterium sp.]
MKNVWKFAKIVILTGCLVLLGLNAAAQGLEKMSPDISHGFLEFSFHNQTITVTALGKEYHFDAGGTMNMMSNIKNQAYRSADQCIQAIVFWGKKYYPNWKEKYQELIFIIQKKANFNY